MEPFTLSPGPPRLVLRQARLADAPALAEAYRASWEHLRRWEPRRDAGFFTPAGQEARLRERLRQFEAGQLVPWVLAEERPGEAGGAEDGARGGAEGGTGSGAEGGAEGGAGRVVGAVTLSQLVRGPFRSASLGYWVAASHTGRGLATAAVRQVCRFARESLSLHRIEASVLPYNAASLQVLARCGFERIGTARAYLHIDGAWRDHELHQCVLHDEEPAD
nr:GNAT family N-acetyltransferase [Streptomyces hoynatensis]